MFDNFDADGSGDLDHGELREGLKHAHLNLRPEDIAKFVAYADRDSGGTIDIDEFMAHFATPDYGHPQGYITQGGGTKMLRAPLEAGQEVKMQEVNARLGAALSDMSWQCVSCPSSAALGIHIGVADCMPIAHVACWCSHRLNKSVPTVRDTWQTDGCVHVYIDRLYRHRRRPVLLTGRDEPDPRLEHLHKSLLLVRSSTWRMAGAGAGKGRRTLHVSGLKQDSTMPWHAQLPHKQPRNGNYIGIADNMFETLTVTCRYPF